MTKKKRGLRGLLADRGLTLTRVAGEIGTSLGHLSEVANRKTAPGPELMGKLSGHLDVPIPKLQQIIDEK